MYSRTGSFQRIGLAIYGIFLSVMWYQPAASASEANKAAGRLTIPYVATRSDTVKDMLWIAGVGKEDVVYDLGSGDGRIVIAAVRDFDAHRAVGIESDPNRIAQSRENALKAGLADSVTFVQEDLFAADVSDADVVALFLGHRPNIKLRPKLVGQLKPGSRVVSHQFAMGEWKPAKELTVNKVYLGMWGEAAGPFSDNPQVPDYTGNESHHGSTDKVFMWVVPAPVAGVWRGQVQTQQGKRELKLTLQQSLSGVQGRFEVAGQPVITGGTAVDLYGSHLRFWCEPAEREYRTFQLRFDGQVDKDTLAGKIAVIEKEQIHEYQYKAARDKANFEGTWQWSGPSDSVQASLHIANGNNGYKVTYTNGEQTVPVTDFYDFDGGFYFTLLIGADENNLVISDDTGWLIGQAVIDNDTLIGRTSFYPASRDQAVHQEWKPQRIEP